MGDDLPAAQRAPLADVLASLRRTRRAAIVASEPVGADRAAVDVEVTLEGGGSARYSIAANRRDDGSWVVISIEGPGASWPPRASPRDEGLSISSPPAPAPAPPR